MGDVAKFNVGNYVQCKSVPEYAGRAFIIINYRRSAISLNYVYECVEVKPVASEHLNRYEFIEEVLEPLVGYVNIPNYTGSANVEMSTPLTDPSVDYEKITENPVYFEFVDVGKALNKLKRLEHNLK